MPSVPWHPCHLFAACLCCFYVSAGAPSLAPSSVAACYIAPHLHMCHISFSLSLPFSLPSSLSHIPPLPSQDGVRLPWTSSVVITPRLLCRTGKGKATNRRALLVLRVASASGARLPVSTKALPCLCLCIFHAHYALLILGLDCLALLSQTSTRIGMPAWLPQARACGPQKSLPNACSTCSLARPYALSLPRPCPRYGMMPSSCMRARAT